MTPGRAWLVGKRVLVTRPAGQGDALADRLRDAGAEPLLVPTIAIGAPDDPARAAAAAGAAHTYDWVAFSSVNGVAAFFALQHPGSLDGVRVAAIGPATAAALAAHGIRPAYLPAVSAGETLAAGLHARSGPARILIFRAQEARDVVPDTLRAAGWTVDVVAAYKTVFVDDERIRAAALQADVVTFASSSAVQGFVFNLPDAARVLLRKCVATTGPVTAKTALALGIRVDIVAERTTVAALVEALLAIPA